MYDTEDELSDLNNGYNHELDSKFIGIEEMMNKKRRVFDDPNEETYNKDEYITTVEIEVTLPVGKFRKFDHNTQKRVCVNWPATNKLDSCSQAEENC